MGKPALIISQIVPIHSLMYPRSWNSYFNHLSCPDFLNNEFYINLPPPAQSFQPTHFSQVKGNEAQISYNYYLSCKPSILFTHRTRGPSTSSPRQHCQTLAWGPFFSSSPQGPNTHKSPSQGSNPTAQKSADNQGGTWPPAYGKLPAPEMELRISASIVTEHQTCPSFSN